MNYEIKPSENGKGFTLFYLGVEIGDSKLQCDATLIAKLLDKQFELEYHRGAKTLERMLEKARVEQIAFEMKMQYKADVAREYYRRRDAGEI